MFKKLADLITQYNNENKAEGGKAFLQVFEKSVDQEKSSTWDPKVKICDTPLVLAICTPLIAQAHQMVQQAGELVFCDSTASLDRYNCPTFVISTLSSAGGIPLGVVITSGESGPVLTEAFSYLKSILPNDAFFGQGVKGPTMIITDDSDAEGIAIKSTWPSSTHLLCIFHYLQCWWKWLWVIINSNHIVYSSSL